jgi:hypothetical protein
MGRGWEGMKGSRLGNPGGLDQGSDFSDAQTGHWPSESSGRNGQKEASTACTEWPTEWLGGCAKSARDQKQRRQRNGRAKLKWVEKRRGKRIGKKNKRIGEQRPGHCSPSKRLTV